MFQLFCRLALKNNPECRHKAVTTDQVSTFHTMILLFPKILLYLIIFLSIVLLSSFIFFCKASFSILGLVFNSTNFPLFFHLLIRTSTSTSDLLFYPSSIYSLFFWKILYIALIGGLYLSVTVRNLLLDISVLKCLMPCPTIYRHQITREGWFHLPVPHF